MACHPADIKRRPVKGPMSSSRAHGHHANTRLFAICTSLIIHLVCPPKLYMRIVFNFSWEHCNAQEKLKTKVMPNYRGQTMCNMRNMQIANECSMALDSNFPRKWKTLNYKHCKPQSIQQSKRISWLKGPHNDDDDIIYLINLTDQNQYVSKLKWIWPVIVSGHSLEIILSPGTGP